MPEGGTLTAGAAMVDVSPRRPQFLFGYPHVARVSTGIHDRLLSSALYLGNHTTRLLLIANDVIYIGRQTALRARARIEAATGVPAAHILVAATHTHSGPVTVGMLAHEADPVVPAADAEYLRLLEDGIVEAAVSACRSAVPCEIGFSVADGSCVGGNRHDPAGPSNPDVPVLVVREAGGGRPLAGLVVCSMHPTVLHEDSTLVSGDFPAMARQHLQEHAWGASCPVVWLTGFCGDQSPRHVARANSFDEARRLGSLLGVSIARAAQDIEYADRPPLSVTTALVDLPRRRLPSVPAARELLRTAEARLAELRAAPAERGCIRTAECDLFGAQETLTLATAAESGRLEAFAASVMPAEVTVVRIGPYTFPCWPGEVDVAFALELRRHDRNRFAVSLVNGELQGYLVTQQAVREHRYEAMNAIFASPDAGELLVAKTIELLERM